MLTIDEQRELDAAIHEKVIGKESLDYCTDRNLVWAVMDAMRVKPFSVRKRFLEAVQEGVWEKVNGTKVAWPDVLWFVTPEIVCRAALKAIEEKGPEQ